MFQCPAAQYFINRVVTKVQSFGHIGNDIYMRQWSYIDIEKSVTIGEFSPADIESSGPSGKEAMSFIFAFDSFLAPQHNSAGHTGSKARAGRQDAIYGGP